MNTNTLRGPHMLDAYSRSIVDVVARVGPAVVSMGVKRADSHTKQLQFGAGSGVIITPHGYIVTNNHVVEQAEVVEFDLTDGRHFPARIVGTEPISDLAAQEGL